MGETNTMRSMPRSSRCRHLRIGETEIGRDGPYVIAEAGVNHNGKIEIALQLIEAAAGAGADAVKFQLFHTDRLICGEVDKAPYQGEGTQEGMLRALELSVQQMLALKLHAHQHDLDFIVTPFDCQSLEELTDIIWPAAIKISSTDTNNYQFIQQASKAARPLIISTGCSTESEVDRAYRAADWRALGIALLHCNAAYPSPVEDLNLAVIRDLRQHYDYVGFSDHSLEIETGAYAVMAGADMLERHITLDSNADGPDHKASTTPEDFGLYVQQARQAWLFRGGSKVITPSEEPNSVAKKHFVAIDNIMEGEQVGAYIEGRRTGGDGISVSEWRAIKGMVANQDIEAGQVIYLGMIDEQQE